MKNRRDSEKISVVFLSRISYHDTINETDRSECAWAYVVAKNRRICVMKQVEIYTDGACSGNPGPGGWAAVLLYGKHIKEISGGMKQSTNQRMELTAAIEALKELKEPCRVKLYSDSAYM